jgi:hypothetical protein
MRLLFAITVCSFCAGLWVAVFNHIMISSFHQFASL